jgi:hypothetical protein
MGCAVPVGGGRTIFECAVIRERRRAATSPALRALDANGPYRAPAARGPSPRPPACGWGCAPGGRRLRFPTITLACSDAHARATDAGGVRAVGRARHAARAGGRAPSTMHHRLSRCSTWPNHERRGLRPARFAAQEHGWRFAPPAPGGPFRRQPPAVRRRDRQRAEGRRDRRRDALAQRVRAVSFDGLRFPKYRVQAAASGAIGHPAAGPSRTPRPRTGAARSSGARLALRASDARRLGTRGTRTD